MPTDTLFLPVNELSDAQQALLSLAPLIGAVVFMLIGIVKWFVNKFTVSSGEAVWATTLNLVFSFLLTLLVTYWLVPDLTAIERILFIGATTGAAFTAGTLLYRGKKAVSKPK